MRSEAMGLVNGIAIGALIALNAYIWKGEPEMGLIAGVATLINILISSITGVVVPLLMNKLTFDPALASPILVTALSDALGYLIYLRLATAAITWIV